MPAKRILCCADLHLGRSSSWISGPDDVDRSSIGAWNRIVERAIAGQADAVIIAGDVFDGPGTYYAARQPLLKGLSRLRSSGIRVLAVAGNHDWSVLPRFARQFEDSGLDVLGLGGEWESRTIAGVNFVGWSFPSETCLTRALDSYSRPRGSAPVVGIVHGDTESTASAYHPISAPDLGRTADAWVLGHIHRPSLVSTNAVYPGSPQALDFGPGEAGAHGFFWLEVDNGKAKFSELQPISTVRFDTASIQLDIDAAEDVAEALERELSAWCGECHRAQPGLASVQLRATVRLTGGATLPSSIPVSDGHHAWEIVSVQVEPRVDLWAMAKGADAGAECARLLIGALATDGGYTGQPVDLPWISAAEAVVGQATADVLRFWDDTVRKVVDEEAEARPERPTRDEAEAISRRGLIAALWESLQASAVLQGEANL